MSRLSRTISIVALLAVSACAARPKEVAVAPPPVVPTVEAYVPPISPINRNLSPAATVWHLRSALNVAALACRGADETTIIARYNALLTDEKAALATAEATLAAEYRATGDAEWRDRYDDSMTRLYNFFSQSQARDAFCATAATVLQDTAFVTPETLTAFATERLPALDAPFAAMVMPQQVIAVAASSPPYVPVTPRLHLDPSIFSQP